MRVIGSISNVMPNSILAAIEHIVIAASDVNGIYETIFAEGIGKIPEGFLVTSSDVEKLVIYATNGTAFHLTMQEETAWNSAVTDKDELAEE